MKHLQCEAPVFVRPYLVAFGGPLALAVIPPALPGVPPMYALILMEPCGCMDMPSEFMSPDRATMCELLSQLADGGGECEALLEACELLPPDLAAVPVRDLKALETALDVSEPLTDRQRAVLARASKRALRRASAVAAIAGSEAVPPGTRLC